MEVLLAKKTLILGSNSQPIAPAAQLQQPALKQLAKPVPTKWFQRSVAKGGAQAHTQDVCIGNLPGKHLCLPKRITHNSQGIGF